MLYRAARRKILEGSQSRAVQNISRFRHFLKDRWDIYVESCLFLYDVYVLVCVWWLRTVIALHHAVSVITECSLMINTAGYVIKRLPDYTALEFIRQYKANPITGLCGPEGSGRLRLQISRHSAHEDCKVVTFTHRPPLPPGISWYSFLEAESTPGHTEMSAATE